MDTTDQDAHQLLAPLQRKPLELAQYRRCAQCGLSPVIQATFHHPVLLLWSLLGHLAHERYAASILFERDDL
ncbi:MAG: hypothetical protein ACREFP_18410 [Acetobacteraceae bacterium]